MNKLHRITIIQSDLGFEVQTLTQQISAKDESEVQEAVRTIVSAICNPEPKPERSTKPTVKHFRGGKEVSEEEALAKPLGHATKSD